MLVVAVVVIRTCAACTVGSVASIRVALDGFGYLLISHFVLLLVRVDGCMRVRLSHFYGARNAMVDGR